MTSCRHILLRRVCALRPNLSVPSIALWYPFIKCGQTELIHGEQFSGLLSGPIMRMIHAETVQGFELMNRALRERSEAGVVAKKR